MFEDLNDDNALLYSIKAYDTPNCIMSEFEDDCKRFNYLNRLFTRYTISGETRERLVINHLIILFNIFGPEAAIRLLFYRTSPEHYSYLKTYLVFLKMMPNVIHGIYGKDIQSSDINIDFKIANVLRQIK